MSTLESAGDFVATYLSPHQTAKNIEFVQLKLHQFSQKIIKRSTDELLLKIACFRKAIELVQDQRKTSSNSSVPSTADLIERSFHFWSTLSPIDALILIGNQRYQLNDSELALILSRSGESIAFRRQQLVEELNAEAIPLENILSISNQTIREQTQTIIQRKPKTFYQGFQGLPFAIRFTLETLGVLLILVALLWIIPEIRNSYETSVQKRINDYLIESALVDAPAPEGTSKTPKSIIPATEVAEEAPAEPPPVDVPAAAKKQPKVSEGETWRFSFTGSMTSELEEGISELLRKIVSGEQKALTVPGGIQFDFVLPVKNLIELKTSLEDMTTALQRKSPSSRQNMMSAANMSWYKRKMNNTRKIPSGHVQVIIWISTL